MNIIVKSKEALRNDPNVEIRDSEDIYKKVVQNRKLNDDRMDIIKANLFGDSFSECVSFVDMTINCFSVVKNNRTFWIAEWCVEETFEDNNEI